MFNTGMEQTGSPWELTVGKSLCIHYCTFHKNSEMSVIPSILPDNYGSRDVDCLVLVTRLVVSSTMQVRAWDSRPLRNLLPNISLQVMFSLPRSCWFPCIQTQVQTWSLLKCVSPSADSKAHDTFAQPSSFLLVFWAVMPPSGRVCHLFCKKRDYF